MIGDRHIVETDALGDGGLCAIGWNSLRERRRRQQQPDRESQSQFHSVFLDDKPNVIRRLDNLHRASNPRAIK
jgi:hypothetical protein